MSDDELVERIGQGDADAAEALVRRYYTAILRYCRNRCGSDERAEDLAQETFLRMLSSLPAYTGRGRFRAFLYTIAGNLCIDESRKVRSYPLEERDLPDRDHDGIRQAEDRAQIDGLLRELSPEQRTAVILRYGEQLSFRQIAQATGCTLRTAQSRVRCALRIMREVWKDEG